MCGIVGYIGKKKVLPILIKGLEKLEYRGYDSSGVSYFLDDKIQLVKSVGRISDLEQKLNLDERSFVGIGHTRWATHGKVNEVNCHPHKCGDVVIVHNGILENYQKLRKILIEKGYEFQGETDSEVACAYIDFLYQENKDDIVSVLEKCISNFEGSYAIVGMITGIDNQLFVMKKDSPLVIGIGDDEFYVASDPIACNNDINSFIYLNDMEFGIVSNDSYVIYKDGKKIDSIITKVNESEVLDEISNFPNYMLKEIYEQVSLIKKWNQFFLERVNDLPDLSHYERIHIVGCGTAYHAGLIGKYLLELYGNIEINVFIASEYRYQKLFLNNNSLVIFVSQSGETADTLACLKRVKEFNVDTLGIVNVENSAIAREVDEVLYTKAGLEIAVASTKAYLSQIYVFSLLAFKLGIKNKQLDFVSIKNTYEELPDLIKDVLDYNYDSYVEKFFRKKDIFYLGRNIDYVTMLEGSLKLKEISYIHAETFPAGELKHGTISLIEEGMPVFALLTNKDLCLKTFSNIKEVKSRGAYTLLFIKKSLIDEIHLDINEDTDFILIPDSCELLQPLINVIPLQMIAYTTAKMRGVDIDKPRNLAKSVTVE